MCFLRHKTKTIKRGDFKRTPNEIGNRNVINHGFRSDTSYPSHGRSIPNRHMVPDVLVAERVPVAQVPLRGEMEASVLSLGQLKSLLFLGREPQCPLCLSDVGIPVDPQLRRCWLCLNEALRPGLDALILVPVIQRQDRKQLLFRDPPVLRHAVMPAAEGDDVLKDVVTSLSARFNVVTIQRAGTSILVQEPVQADAVTPARL
jgi:hypothetical protein